MMNYWLMRSVKAGLVIVSSFNSFLPVLNSRMKICQKTWMKAAETYFKLLFILWRIYGKPRMPQKGWPVFEPKSTRIQSTTASQHSRLVTLYSCWINNDICMDSETKRHCLRFCKDREKYEILTSEYPVTQPTSNEIPLYMLNALPLI